MRRGLCTSWGQGAGGARDVGGAGGEGGEGGEGGAGSRPLPGGTLQGSLYVTGLEHCTSKADLEELFCPFGVVAKCFMLHDISTNATSGSAKIVYAGAEQAESVAHACASLDGRRVGSKYLSVKPWLGGQREGGGARPGGVNPNEEEGTGDDAGVSTSGGKA